jgi:hypothetical protein
MSPLSKNSFCLPCFQASAAPRPENSDSDEKDKLFGLGPQITISRKYLVASNVKLA